MIKFHAAVFAVSVILAPAGVRADESRPLDAPVISWGGFYAGGAAGFTNSTTDLTTVASNTAFYPDFGVGQFNSPNLKGGYFGGEVGYNRQSGSLVYGLYSALYHSNADDITWSIGACCGAGDDRFHSRLDTIGIIGGRLGWTYDRWLLSATAGYAIGRYDLAIQDTNVKYNGTLGIGSTGRGSDSRWLSGLQLGGGVDVALSEHWSLGLDYKVIIFAGDDLKSGGTGLSNLPTTYVMSPEDLRTHLFGAAIKYRF